MGVFGFLQVWDARLGNKERAARVDLVHQIVALHVGLKRAGELDGAGIVDADVDAAERCDGLCDGIGDLRLLGRMSQTTGSALPPAFSISSAAV